MIRIKLDDIVPGMELARPVQNSLEQVLLQQGALMTESFVERLRGFGFDRVWVNEPKVRDVRPASTFTERTRYRLASRFRDLLSLSAPASGALKQLYSTIDMVVSEAKANTARLVVLPDDGPNEFPLLTHSVNVCLIAAGMGAVMNMTYDNLWSLALGALLHDLGHSQHPNSRTMTANELDSLGPDHVLTGFQVVINSWQAKATTAAVCVQHHERCDGTGYPQRLHNERIHINSRITAVADAYDNLASISGVLPHMAVERVLSLAGEVFDVNVVTHFYARFVPYPPGSPLLLGTGDQAVVVSASAGQTCRPVVRVLPADGHVRDIPLYDCPSIRIAEERWVANSSLHVS